MAHIKGLGASSSPCPEPSLHTKLLVNLHGLWQ
jgi:hypothetical protein